MSDPEDSTSPDQPNGNGQTPDEHVNQVDRGFLVVFANGKASMQPIPVGDVIAVTAREAPTTDDAVMLGKHLESGAVVGSTARTVVKMLRQAGERQVERQAAERMALRVKQGFPPSLVS